MTGASSNPGGSPERDVGRAGTDVALAARGGVRPSQPELRERLDPRTIVLALVVVLGAMMSMIDTTAVNVALDTLGRDLHASLSSVQWVVTGYLLALGLVMPASAWAVDRFGAKPLWMLSVALFVGGSALSGVAWSIGSLILFRLVQGAAGGMLLPVGQTILARTAGPQRMGRVMSLLGLPLLIGPVLGPILGGLLVQDVSWHWIFYINVPVGLLALALAARLLPTVSSDGRARLDVPGLVLASTGLAVLIYGLSRAGIKGGFGYPSVYDWMIAGAALLAIFIFYSLRRGPAALIDMRLFTNRALSTASVTTFLVGIGLFGGMLLLPLYYQLARGEGALSAGLLLVPQGLGAASAMWPAGRLTDRLGARIIVLPGITFALLGTIAYTQVTAHTSYVLLSTSLYVRGLGLGATLLPAVAAAYATMSHENVPRATTTIQIVRQIGGSFGSALLAVVLATDIAHRLPATAGNAGLGQLSNVAPSARAHLAPPLAAAFGQTFWIAFALTAAVYLPAWLLPHGVPESRRSPTGGVP